MGRKTKVKTDFSANPDNVQIGDWVVKKSNKLIGKVIVQAQVIGEVIERVDTSESMLKFWVSWFDYISKVPTPELASNLVKIPSSEDDGYVGQSIAQGLISSMIWHDEEVKYEVYKDKQTIVKTREQIESAIRQSSLTALDSDSDSVNLDNIIIDPNLQQRVKLDNSVIDDYSIAYQEGVELPPITIWKCTDEPGNREQGIGNREDNVVARSQLPVPRYYLVDGFHRAAAAKQAGIDELPFTEKSGTYREALLFSLGVNATHGLRRSNSDKRKAVMTLLNDSEWSTWSDRTIASQCQVSHTFVAKLRNQLSDNSNLTVNVASGNQKNDEGNLTVNVASGNQENYESNLTVNVASGNQQSNEQVTRTYITKDGVEAKMRIGNIGKGKSSESLPSEEDNEIIPEQLSEDIEVEVTTTSGFEENNHSDSVPVEIDDAQTDIELKDSANTKRSKGKQKITNPLSVGDKVKVKNNHYFGGKEGVVTQISSPHSVIVAFDDDQREFIRLLDLDLPESLVKPKPQKSSRPVKKEILIKEGLNYKAGVPGYGCKWYVEVEEEVYKGLQVYQKKVSTPTLNAAFSRFLVEKGILKYHPDNPTKLLDIEDTTPTLKALNISATTLNILQQYVNKHGEEALLALL